MEIEKLLELSTEHQASDLHLVPELPPLLRINGALSPLPNADTLSSAEVKRLIYTVMTTEQQRQFEEKLVLETAIHSPGVGHFRVGILHQLRGISAVFRVIPESVPSFEELSLPHVFKSLLGLSHGLILVTGPTGSGKSTTLAAMIDHINEYRTAHIITIEDPIEFVYEPKKSIFNQIQVGRDAPDFATALRASLRLDPNVILLGELRDLETMRLALTAAETGHLIFATLHAVSAPLAVNRFVDVFPYEEKNKVRNLLSETLQAIICQTLVKKMAGGRTAAFEILLATTPIRHYIRQDMIGYIESTMQTSVNKGMCTLEQYLHQLVEQQVIHTSVATNVIENRGSFKEVKTAPDPRGVSSKK